VPPDSRFGRFDQQLLAWVAAEAEPEEIEPRGEGDDVRFVLVQGKAPGCQPSGELRPDSLGLLPGVAADDEVVGVPDQDRGVLPDVVGVDDAAPVLDPGGFLKAVQRDVQQQRADYPAL
jgi:hypothetical protein